VNGQVWNTPWKIQNELRRWPVYPCVRVLFTANDIRWREGWRFYGIPVIQKHRRSRMSFSPGLQLRSSLRSNPLGANHPVMLATWAEGSCLEVGANFAMTGGSLCAAKGIVIGDNVVVGAKTSIIDTNFHPLDRQRRRNQPSAGRVAPVTLEDDVLGGMDCLILKGVTIGAGSVVGAGSVIAASVPPGVLVAGNPARIVREL